MLNRIKESLLNKTNVKLVKRTKQLNFDKKNAPYVVIVIAIVRKTKPSVPYYYDYDALTTTFSCTIFDSHRVLTWLTATITIMMLE